MSEHYRKLREMLDEVRRNNDRNHLILEVLIRDLEMDNDALRGGSNKPKDQD